MYKLPPQIKSFLKTSKMSQRDFCKLVKGLSESELSRILNGKIAPAPIAIRIENAITSWECKVDRTKTMLDSLYTEDEPKVYAEKAFNNLHKFNPTRSEQRRIERSNLLYRQQLQEIMDTHSRNERMGKIELILGCICMGGLIATIIFIICSL